MISKFRQNGHICVCRVGLLSRITPVGEGLKFSKARARYPTTGSECGWYGQGASRVLSSGVSKHYFAVIRLALGGLQKEILIVGAHLKAKPNHPRSCSQREAQAEVLAKLVTEHGLRHQPPREVILMGDLNDFDMNIRDTSNNKPNSRVLRMLTDDLGLKNALTKIWDQSQRYTWKSRDPRSAFPPSALDHILLSPGLFERLDAVWVQRPGNNAGVRASDHFPLVVRFRLGASTVKKDIPGLVGYDVQEL